MFLWLFIQQIFMLIFLPSLHIHKQFIYLFILAMTFSYVYVNSYAWIHFFGIVTRNFYLCAVWWKDIALKFFMAHKKHTTSSSISTDGNDLSEWDGNECRATMVNNALTCFNWYMWGFFVNYVTQKNSNFLNLHSISVIKLSQILICL